MTTVMAYYKGTGLNVTLIAGASFQDEKKDWEKQIVLFLKEGYSMNELKELYQGQLDVMEQIWFDGEKKFEKDIDRRIKYMETEYKFGNFDEIKMKWFVSVACLLKLKVINDDDMNGFVIIEGLKDV